MMSTRRRPPLPAGDRASINFTARARAAAGRPAARRPPRRRGAYFISIIHGGCLLIY